MAARGLRLDRHLNQPLRISSHLHILERRDTTLRILVIDTHIEFLATIIPQQNLQSIRLIG